MRFDFAGALRRAGVIAFILTIAAAASAEEPGPTLGAPAPHDLSAIDSTGAPRTFDDLAGDNGLVVYFNRSLEWCPYCLAQAIDLNARAVEFEERGYGVVILTTDTPETLARAAARRDLTLPLLSDADSEIISAFNLLDPAFPEGTRMHGLPYPATAVLGPDREVQALLFVADAYGEAKGYRQRITVDDVLAEIDAAAGS